jgi:hypothetical protein
VSDFLDYVDWFTNRTKQWGRFLEMLAGQTQMAVMLIEAPTLMGKTFLIKRMAHHCDKESFAYVYIDFAGHQVTSYLWLARQVREQLAPQVGEKFFGRLNQQINRYTDPRHAGKASGPRQTVYHLRLDLDDETSPQLVRLDLVVFRDKLIDSFSQAEMRDLAFALGLHHDDIEGATRSAYALGLITRCEADDLLPKLLVLVRSERSSETWCHELSDEERAAWLQQQEAEADQAGDDAALEADLGFETLPADEVVLREAKAAINRALQQCLISISEEHRVAFLFDSYERGDKESGDWLNDNLLMPVVNKKMINSLLIVAGQEVPDVGDRKPIVGKTGLDLFSKEHVREYIEEKRKVEPTVDPKIDFFQVSQGNPYILATVVSNMTIPTAADDSW